MLKSRNYSVNHLHLNPTQVLIPNDRPRYYCIAILGLDSDSHKQHLESSCERETPRHEERIDSWFLSKLDKDDGPLTNSRKIQTKIDPLGVEDERDVKITKQGMYHSQGFCVRRTKTNCGGR